jgi:5-methylthioadenosine/S-adenosylhomocysteine deaminase
MYLHLDSLASSALQTGIRAVISNDIALPEHNLDSVADNILAFTRTITSATVESKSGLVLNEFLSLTSQPLLKEIRRMKKELGTGVHTHSCESRAEIADCMKRFGKLPVEMAYEAGILGPHYVTAHCVHLSDREIQLLAETKTSVSHNAGVKCKA